MDWWEAGGLAGKVVGRNVKRRLAAAALVAFLVLGWVNEELRDRVLTATMNSYRAHVEKRFDRMIQNLPVPTTPPATTRTP